jgi:hypothetical protein
LKSNLIIWITFTETLDNALKSLNSDYEAKRHKNMALRMPLGKSNAARHFLQLAEIEK